MRRRDVEGEDVVERGVPVVVALAGAAEDEVEVPGGEAGRGARRPRSASAASGHVAPPEAGQHVGVGRLQSEGDPRHPGRAGRPEVGVVGVLGIALDGHLGARCAGHGVEDAAQGVGVEAGRGAPSEEDGGGSGEAAVLDGTMHLEDARRPRSAP